MRLRSWSLVVASRGDLTKLAEATGGFSVTNTDDYEPGFKRLVSELEHYYVLGFYPDLAGRRYRDVTVTVQRSDANVRSKLGYVPPSDRQRAEVADALNQLSTQAVANNSLPLRLFCSPIAKTKNSLRLLVALELRVPASGLKRDGSLLSDTLDGMLLAIDANSTKTVRRIPLQRELSFHPDTASGRVEVSYQVLTTIDLGPNRYQLRASARSAAAGREGSVYGVADLTAHKGNGLSMGALILGRADAANGSVASPRPVFLPFAPVLVRRFSSAESIRVWSAVFGQSAEQSIAIRAELINAAGAVVRNLNGLASVQRPSSDATATIDITLNLAGLPGGSYLIRLTATSAVSTVTSETSLVIDAER
jgi:hypothetical protein